MGSCRCRSRCLPNPAPRGARATLEPLQDVILRDLQKGAVAGVEKELDQLSVPERVGRLLSPDDDIFKR